VLDDLGHSVYARGFSDGLHEGIASLVIHAENDSTTHTPSTGRITQNSIVGGNTP
jgi:hypothetical protein